MKKLRIFHTLRRQKVVFALLLTTLAAVGLSNALLTHDVGLEMGDGATFYSFARNLSDGEAIYKDFIHFRTPGSYFLNAFFIKLLGEQQSSVAMAIKFEVHVLYPVVFLISVFLIVRKLRNWLVLVGTAFFAILFYPGIVQLRAGFALLAVAVYINGINGSRHPNRMLLLSGLFTGVAFIFGQETAAMAAMPILAAEMLAGNKLRIMFNRLKLFAAGGLIGVFPLILYVLIWANLSDFIYYVGYYAFVRQPQFMDIPFPALGYDTFFFYLPLLAYFICFFIAYHSPVQRRIIGLLLGFSVLRLITAMGRSDLGHLLFVLPEMFVVIPLIMSNVRSVALSKKSFLGWMPYGAVVFVSFTLATMKSSIFLVSAAIAIVIAMMKAKDAVLVKSRTPTNSWLVLNTYGSLMVVTALWLLFLFPQYVVTLRSIKAEALHDVSVPRIGGQKVDDLTLKEINDVREVIGDQKIETMFSYPIQPFYYSLAEDHATRFMTHEPQTTVEEQRQTISDLKTNKPEIVVFDASQAEGLSGSLWEISHYLTSNFAIERSIKYRNLIWVMRPAANEMTLRYLVFQLYKDNERSPSTLGIPGLEKGATNAIHHTDPLVFSMSEEKSQKLLKLGIIRADSKNDPRCGLIKIDYSHGPGSENRTCIGDGELSIPIDSNKGSYEIILMSEGNKSQAWNNPRIVDAN